MILCLLQIEATASLVSIKTIHHYHLIINVVTCTETGVEISEGIRSYLPPDENGIVFKYDHIIFENRIFLYSIDFRVIVKQEVDRDEPIYEGCIVGFLGENSELLAYTDVHRLIISLSKVT